MITLLSILVFVSIYVFILAIFTILAKERTFLQKRLNDMVIKGPHQIGLANNKSKQAPIKELITKLSSVFAAKSYSIRVEKELIKGGIPLKGEEFITIRLLTTAGTGLLLTTLTGDLAIGIILGACAFIAPMLVVRYNQNKRMKRFNAQIGDSLIVMANSLRAGFSFFQALDLVSKEMPDPISGEFGKVLREINLGTPTEEALVNLNERVGSDDLDLLITAVLIQRQVGGNLSEVLDNISHTIRERIRIKGEIKALTAQGKISGLVIGLLPVILGLVLFMINRSYIMGLFTNAIGISLVVGGIISEILGLILVKKIVDIDV